MKYYLKYIYTLIKNVIINLKKVNKNIKYFYLLLNYKLDFLILKVKYNIINIIYLILKKNKSIEFYFFLIYNYIQFISFDVNEDYKFFKYHFNRLKIIFYKRNLIKHFFYFFFFFAGLIPLIYFFIFLFFYFKYLFKYIFLTLDFFYYNDDYLIFYYFYNYHKYCILDFFDNILLWIDQIETFLFKMNRIEKFKQKIKQKIFTTIENKKNEKIQQLVDFIDNFLLVTLPIKLIEWEYDFWHHFNSLPIYYIIIKAKLKNKKRKIKWIIKWYILKIINYIQKNYYNFRMMIISIRRNYYERKKNYKYYRYNIQLYQIKWSIRMLGNWWFWDYIFCWYIGLAYDSFIVTLKYIIIITFYKGRYWGRRLRHKKPLNMLLIEMYLESFIDYKFIYYWYICQAHFFNVLRYFFYCLSCLSCFFSFLKKRIYAYLYIYTFFIFKIRTSILFKIYIYILNKNIILIYKNKLINKINDIGKIEPLLFKFEFENNKYKYKKKWIIFIIFFNQIPRIKIYKYWWKIILYNIYKTYFIKFDSYYIYYIYNIDINILLYILIKSQFKYIWRK